MNILIPHTWLLEHLDTKVTPEEIQKFASLCGPSIERIYEREGEAVYDIEVTTNRVDSMSVRGIAREVAVILEQFGKKAKLKPLELKKENELRTGKDTYLPLPAIIDDEKICKRTLAVVLSNVQRSATPDWMAKRLRQTEMNVHDAVIDITNYVTHELGHPCHAFDYDRVMELGGMIIIKHAKKGKKFTTLDNATYTTVGGEVVFENDKGEIIDFPGIKGTANTSINQSTKNVLFWIENIEPKEIRFASMTHAIRTVAAQLNEKNVDPELAWPVLVRAVELFQELCGAQIASKVYDHFPARKKPRSITISLDTITRYLGVELPVNQMASILEALECEVVLKKQQLIVTPPSFRPDIEIPADVVEEIARIYGYHNLPSVVMPTAIPLNKPTDLNFYLENRMKHFLADIGWQEVYTYSMVSEILAAESGYELVEHLKIQNPLSDDRVYLRRSLIPSLEEVISNNPQRKELSIFEIANIYPPQQKGLPAEHMRLTLVSTLPYRDVKGSLEALLEHSYIKHSAVVESTPQINSPYSQIGDVFVLASGKKEKQSIGVIGVLKNGHIALDLEVRQLIAQAQTHPEYKSLPKTSEIIEDLTFTLPADIAVGPLMMNLKNASEFISSVSLKDIYQQNFTFTITYNAPDHNLNAEEIMPVRKSIVEIAKKEARAQLVGNIDAKVTSE